MKSRCSLFVVCCALIAAFALAGCAVDTIKSSISADGAALMDKAAHDAEFVTCRGISVGAWVRKYGGNPALASAWRTLCGQTITETPTK